MSKQKPEQMLFDIINVNEHDTIFPRIDEPHKLGTVVEASIWQMNCGEWQVSSPLLFTLSGIFWHEFLGYQYEWTDLVNPKVVHEGFDDNAYHESLWQEKVSEE